MRLQLRVVNKSIGGVVVSALAAGTVDRGFESRASQTKDYKICMLLLCYVRRIIEQKLVNSESG